MGTQRSSTVDIVMLGSFGVWTRGTLQSRALPLARSLAASTDLRFAIVTTPWDAPGQSGVDEVVDDVLIHNTRFVSQSRFPLAVSEQLRYVRESNPALVHVMKPKAYAGLTALALARTCPRPILVVDHDDWEGDGGWNDRAGYSVPARRLFALQERRLLQSADVVTAASTLLSEHARRLRRERHDPGVTYLPNGLDGAWMNQLGGCTNRWDDRHPLELVLYSRFAEFSMAWLNLALRALDRMVQRPVTLHVVGRDKPVDPKLDGFDRLSVHWHGYVERSRLPALLSRSAIALYPYEDNLINRSKQSVKLLELMASGCAIVATDVGDVRRVGGDTVLTVQPGDAAAFARAVYSLIVEPRRAADLGRCARERSGGFTIDRLAGRLYNAYLDCGLR